VVLDLVLLHEFEFRLFVRALWLACAPDLGVICSLDNGGVVVFVLIVVVDASAAGWSVGRRNLLLAFEEGFCTEAIVVQVVIFCGVGERVVNVVVGVVALIVVFDFLVVAQAGFSTLLLVPLVSLVVGVVIV